jgi:hypothetical protein
MSSWEETYDEPNEQSSRQRLIINELLREQQQRNNAFARPMEYIFEDVTGQKIRVSLILALPNGIYKDAQEHAKSCLIMTLKLRKIHAPGIVNWIQSMILCFNPILKFYIEDKLNEEVISSPYNGMTFGSDRRFFKHLEMKHQSTEHRYQTGAMFNALYENLNDNKHLVKDADGKIRIVRLKYKSYVGSTANYASAALINLEKTFYQEFEECRIER